MNREAKAHDTFTAFIHEIGVPHELHSDNAKVQLLGEFRQKFQKHEVHLSATESQSPWQNDTERQIKIIKIIGRYLMQSTTTPIIL